MSVIPKIMMLIVSGFITKAYNEIIEQGYF